MDKTIDWNTIDLVVFDVDGTLYDQRRLRFAMLRQLLTHAWRSRSLDTLKVLRTFRRVREGLGGQPGIDFLKVQYAQTALRHNRTEEEVRALTSEWLEERPLPYLADALFPHLHNLFAALREAGKQIAVFSDYPATEKLMALGLKAHPIVCATDADIARLKPDPFGLLSILRQTGVTPQRALMIGDRFDRDAAAAKHAGVRALIRTNQVHAEFRTFRAYDDSVFHPVLMNSRSSTTI